MTKWLLLFLFAWGIAGITMFNAYQINDLENQIAEGTKDRHYGKDARANQKELLAAFKRVECRQYLLVTDKTITVERLERACE